jgi:DNA-directed RNA polymerase sigma subunit (sigma70/sigma32)
MPAKGNCSAGLHRVSRDEGLAAETGMTIERVQQLQNEALAKLRDPERRASLVAVAS